MKKLFYLILATQLMFGCNVIKNIKKDRKSEKSEQEIEVKTDSIVKSEIEQEIISTFVSDSVFKTIDLSEETTVVQLDTLGRVTSIVTTKKSNVKSSGEINRNNRFSETKKENTKIDLSKTDKSKKSHNLNEKKSTADIKKSNTSIWFWIALGVGALICITGFILFLIWKFKKRNVAL